MKGLPFGGSVRTGVRFFAVILGLDTVRAVCFVCLDIPNNGGILLGAIAGVTAGFLTDRAVTRRAAARDALDVS